MVDFRHFCPELPTHITCFEQGEEKSKPGWVEYEPETKPEKKMQDFDDGRDWLEYEPDTKPSKIEEYEPDTKPSSSSIIIKPKEDSMPEGMSIVMRSHKLGKPIVPRIVVSEPDDWNPVHKASSPDVGPVLISVGPSDLWSSVARSQEEEEAFTLKAEAAFLMQQRQLQQQRMKRAAAVNKERPI